MCIMFNILRLVVRLFLLLFYFCYTCVVVGVTCYIDGVGVVCILLVVEFLAVTVHHDVICCCSDRC